jgi:hypothetical protein
MRLPVALDSPGARALQPAAGSRIDPKGAQILHLRAGILFLISMDSIAAEGAWAWDHRWGCRRRPIRYRHIFCCRRAARNQTALDRGLYMAATQIIRGRIGEVTSRQLQGAGRRKKRLQRFMAKPEMPYPEATALKPPRAQGAAALRKAGQDTPSPVLL